MEVRVTSRFLVEGDSSLDAESDRLFEALIECEEDRNDLSQADVAVALLDKIVELSVVVKADGWDDAQRVAQSAFKSAIESAGGIVNFGESRGEAVPRAHLIQGTELVPA